MSKSIAPASLTPIKGKATSLWPISRANQRMQERRENTRKASGSMQVLLSRINSNPMGQEHIAPDGRFKHRWLQPTNSGLLHGLTPSQITRINNNRKDNSDILNKNYVMLINNPIKIDIKT